MRFSRSGLRVAARWLAALPPEREDWLLIEPESGLKVPIPDFHRAKHGRLFERRKGVPSAKEERRLIGPRLLIFLILYPIIVVPVAIANAAVEYGGAWSHAGLWHQLYATIVLRDGRLNPPISLLMLYPFFALNWIFRIVWVQLRVRQAHCRIRHRDGRPLALHHITPQLELEYLATSDRAYIVGLHGRSCIRYRQGNRTMEFPVHGVSGSGCQMCVGVPCGRPPAWTGPAGLSIAADEYQQILNRVQSAVRFAGYMPKLTAANRHDDHAVIAS